MGRNTTTHSTTRPQGETTNATTPPNPGRGTDRGGRRRGNEGRDGRNNGGRNGRGPREPRVQFDPSGTSHRTDTITHLTCNCGSTNEDTIYRQCLVSLHRPTTYFTALTLFDTSAYTSFVNREVAEWLEQ